MDISYKQRDQCYQKGLLCLVIFMLFLFAQKASADTAQLGNPDFVLDEIQRLLTGYRQTILGYARTLFMGLASVSLALGIIKHILSGDSNLGSVFIILVRWILFVSVFMWLMGGMDGKGVFLPNIITQSFFELGEKLTGSLAKPGDVLVSGVKLCAELWDAARKHGWVETFVAGLNCIVLMLIFSMLSTFLTVALIEMYIVVCGGSILLGFAGLENTRDIAMGYLKYCVAVGIKVLIIMVIASMAMTIVSEWVKNLTAPDPKSFFEAMAFLTGGTGTLALAAYFVPNIAQSAVSGTSIGGSVLGAVAAAVGAAKMVKAGYNKVTGKDKQGGTSTRKPPLPQTTKPQPKKPPNVALPVPQGGSGPNGGGSAPGGGSTSSTGSNYVSPPSTTGTTSGAGQSG